MRVLAQEFVEISFIPSDDAVCVDTAEFDPPEVPH